MKHKGMTVARELRRLQDEEVTLDTALATLRERGYSLIDCIKAVREVRRVRLGEAKSLVSRSPAWSGLHKANVPLHDALIASLQGSRDNVGDARESGDTSV